MEDERATRRLGSFREETAFLAQQTAIILTAWLFLIEQIPIPVVGTLRRK
jgi:hypothetical protein